MKKIASNFLYTPDGIIPRVKVTIDTISGVITDLSRWENIDSEPFTEFYSGIMVPSFVNAHTHLELAALKGKIAPGVGNALFASKIGSVRREVSPEDSLHCMQQQNLQMWESGTGYVADISNDASSFCVKKASPIKYHTFLECFGLKNSNIESLLALRDDSHTLSAHSMYAIQDSDLRKIMLMQEGPLSLHFGESKDEDAIFRREGNLYKWYQKENFNCDFLHYHSITERLIKTIPKDRKLILVHCSHIGKNDIEQIMSHFDEVYWVLCPRSNRYISNFDITKSDVWNERHRLNICFGTDSLASNHTENLLDEILELQESPQFLLKALTSTGYKLMSVEKLPWIERGNIAHISIISGIDSNCNFTQKAKIRRII